MREHDYSIHGEHSYCNIVNSKLVVNESLTCLEIYYQGDGPTEEGLIKFIEEEYPTLDTKAIDIIYHNQSMWFCDWNVGNPQESSPFMFFNVFFKR